MVDKMNYDINEHISKIMNKILDLIDNTTNLTNRNVKPISVLECVPIYRDIVKTLLPNLKHIKNSFKSTLKELFVELTKSLNIANEVDNDSNKLRNMIKRM